MMEEGDFGVEDYQQTTEVQGRGGAGGAGLNLGALLPGGVSPGPQELAVAGIILAALLFVIAVRKGFRPVLNR